MEMIPVTPERKAQLEDYASRHGQDTATALDEVLANYLEWDRQDYNETVEAVVEAYEYVRLETRNRRTNSWKSCA